MLAQKSTKGYENKQIVEIYENEVVANSGAIDMAKGEGKPKEEWPEPVMKTVIYIKAGLPQANSCFEGPIKQHHKENFPRTWEAFQQGKDRSDVDGTPLAEIPGITSSIISEYEKLGISSIEQLVDVDDNAIANFPHGLKMRERAKNTLSVLSDSKVEETASKVEELEAAFQEFKQEKDAEKEADKAKIAELEEKLKAAEAKADEKPAAKTKTAKKTAEAKTEAA